VKPLCADDSVGFPHVKVGHRQAPYFESCNIKADHTVCFFILEYFIMKIKPSFLALFLSISLILSSSIFAFEKSHLEAAKELVELFKMDKMMDTMYAAMNTNLVNSMVKEKACLESIKKPLADLMLKYNKKIINPLTFKDSIQNLYANEFSEKELREIIAFYNSPVGKKTLEKMPNLMVKASEVAQKELEKAQKDGIMEEFQNEMKKLIETADCPQAAVKEEVKN
jgi:hypothetical protein